jgi:hypothetical protein
VYAYVGALLASGKLSFDDVGPLQNGIVSIDYEKARHDAKRIYGGIPFWIRSTATSGRTFPRRFSTRCRSMRVIAYR